ncbi:MAG: nitrophenyl compound nitroreductase subunit ArsF family protein [Bacteroidetes bacterium]|nr:nitrophenyl compound nitroreductase subunit ArsF family protein [Bacteroidota bacterium]
MRKIIFISLILSIALTFLNAQTKPVAGNKPRLEVYYFHPTERCPIDQAVEENTKKVIQTYFAKEIKEGTIRYMVVNTENKGFAKLVARFEINAQALYIVKNDQGKEVKNDLTEFAFSYGLSNPERFKARLKEEILKALKQ